MPSIQRPLATIPVLFLLAGGGLAQTGPLPVSPGGLERLTSVRDGCPTFSWSGSLRARGYQLAVFELSVERQGPSNDQPVLEQGLPAGVTSWTADLGRCLKAGGDYAWVVRARGEGGAAGSWSRPRLFRVEPSPSPGDLDSALEVLARYLAAGEDRRGSARQKTSSRRRPRSHSRGCHG